MSTSPANSVLAARIELLEQQRLLLETLLANQHVAVALHAADGSLLYANPRALDLLGYALCAIDEADRGAQFYDELGQPLSSENAPVQRVLSSRQPLAAQILRLEGALVTADLWLKAEATPIFDPQGELRQVVVTYSDISELKQLQQQTLASQAKLLQHYYQDPLTGLYNRPAVLDRLLQEVRRCERYHEPLSLLLLDLDECKAVIDRYGMPMGDEVLLATARAISSNLREVDVVGRYGTDVFLLILPRVRQEGAIQVAERIRAEVEELRFSVPALTLTVSAGLTWLQPGESADDLIQRVESQLLRAKQSGRNRVRAG